MEKTKNILRKYGYLELLHLLDLPVLKEDKVSMFCDISSQKLVIEIESND